MQSPTENGILPKVILENFESAKKWIEENDSSPNKHHLLFIIDEMQLTKKIFFKII